jgi:Uma2 family endonuclease
LRYAGLRMTAREFLALGETRERLELIDGVVTVSPRPSFRHQRVSYLITRAIDEWAQGRPGAYFAQDVSVELAPSLVYEPDIIAFAPGKFDSEPERITGAPDFVIELSSPGTRRMDLDTKLADYQRFGVKEYGVVDPFTAEARVFRRSGVKFEEVNPVGDRLESSALPGFVLDLTHLRAAQ